MADDRAPRTLSRGGFNVSGAAFEVDPSWPTIEELAVRLWGKVTGRYHGGNELRFGANESKSVKVRECVWHDHESGISGGYIKLWGLLYPGTPLPPRTGQPRPAQPKPVANGHADGNGKDRTPPWEDVGVVYPYRAATGALILQVVRTISRKPRFRQRRPDGELWNGETKWKWNVSDIPGHDCLLYRLPELLASPDATVFVTEGEKDADNLTKLGLTATTGIGGSGKWRAEYAEVLQGRDVVILPDNDAPGTAHAEAAARSLRGVAASVRVLMLPDLAHKGDVSDWIEAGGTKAELEWLVESQAPWPDQAPPVIDDNPPVEGEPPDEDDDGGDDGPPPEWIEVPPDPNADPDDGLISEQYALRKFVEINKEVMRFNHASNTWLIWAEHYWKPDERKLAFSWALNLCRQLAGSVRAKDPTKARLVIEKVRFSGAVEQGARTMPEVATTQGDWDADQMILGTPGGVVDLRTGILRHGQPTDMISRVTRVTPSETLDCPTWLAFLTYAMNDNADLVGFLRRYFGYCLTGMIKEEVFLFLFGPGGAGKGTLVETIADILGEYSGAMTMEVFTGQTRTPVEYYRASMAGKRMIVSTEPERGVFWAEGFIKEITGGDSLSGRHPMGRPFVFKPNHKLVMSGNHMPRLKGRSTGMERRLRIVPVTRKPVTVDRGLKLKLLAEGPGILRWMIEGCLEWQKIGLAPPDEVTLAGNKYFSDQDTFNRWVEECCQLDAYAELPPASLNKSFNDWAKANNEPLMNGNAFSEAIDQFESDPPVWRGRTHGKRWVRGLLLNPPKSASPWDNP
jgi:putative DNA primase/helicase